jgi:hypothetical protein
MALQSQSSGAFNLSILLGTLKQIGIYLEQGVVRATEFIADKLKAEIVITNQLCLGSTCVGETELKALLEKNGVAPRGTVPAPSPTTQPVSPAPTPAATPVAEPSP